MTRIRQALDLILGNLTYKKVALFAAVDIVVSYATLSYLFNELSLTMFNLVITATFIAYVLVVGVLLVIIEKQKSLIAQLESEESMKDEELEEYSDSNDCCGTSREDA